MRRWHHKYCLFSEIEKNNFAGFVDISRGHATVIAILWPQRTHHVRKGLVWGVFLWDGERSPSFTDQLSGLLESVQ